MTLIITKLTIEHLILYVLCIGVFTWLSVSIGAVINFIINASYDAEFLASMVMLLSFVVGPVAGWMIASWLTS